MGERQVRETDPPEGRKVVESEAATLPEGGSGATLFIKNHLPAQPITLPDGKSKFHFPRGPDGKARTSTVVTDAATIKALKAVADQYGLMFEDVK